ncbi:uncharacterized protein LOC110712901 [Chenopodium quinoa]|uniref:uncharacterized protein LOC110712901 n=1 Tax=Chenopodium quinoa TaxID=63459 RepID=UPI000B798EC7|nr:uncharacterized protein LOC110712901 [Chenopodium quinoa]
MADIELIGGSCKVVGGAAVVEVGGDIAVVDVGGDAAMVEVGRGATREWFKLVEALLLVQVVEAPLWLNCTVSKLILLVEVVSNFMGSLSCTSEVLSSLAH